MRIEIKEGSVTNPDPIHPQDFDVTISFRNVRSGFLEKFVNLVDELNRDLQDGKINPSEGIRIGSRVYDLTQ